MLLSAKKNIHEENRGRGGRERKNLEKVCLGQFDESILRCNQKKEWILSTFSANRIYWYRDMSVFTSTFLFVWFPFLLHFLFKLMLTSINTKEKHIAAFFFITWIWRLVGSNDCMCVCVLYLLQVYFILLLAFAFDSWFQLKISVRKFNLGLRQNTFSLSLYVHDSTSSTAIQLFGFQSNKSEK